MFATNGTDLHKTFINANSSDYIQSYYADEGYRDDGTGDLYCLAHDELD